MGQERAEDCLGADGGDQLVEGACAARAARLQKSVSPSILQRSRERLFPCPFMPTPCPCLISTRFPSRQLFDTFVHTALPVLLWDHSPASSSVRMAARGAERYLALRASLSVLWSGTSG